jgi:hypothetical protein
MSSPPESTAEATISDNPYSSSPLGVNQQVFPTQGELLSVIELVV